jgi:hypothetical protein
MTVAYSTIKTISEAKAMAEFLAERIIGPALPSAQIKRVRSRPGRRYEAPRVLWNVYEAEIELPEGTEIRCTFWTKAFFDEEILQRFKPRVDRLLASQNGNPLDPRGHAKFFPELNLFVFFFPVDPAFPALGTVFDPMAIRSILDPEFAHVAPGTSLNSISAHRIKYLPEISCIVRYDAETGTDAGLSIFGKVQHSKRGRFTYDVMRALWDLPARASGELILAEPLGYYPKLDLLLQSKLPGDDIVGDRHSEVFLAQCEAAGRTLGHIHSSGIKVGNPHTVDVELGRLYERLEEFKMAAPKVYFLLRGLLAQISARAAKVPEEDVVASHGDYKYNQFLHDNGKFGLIDVEYFVQAEPSFDLGKYCGHLVPSSPKHWSDTAQANECRRVFLEAYLRVRPEYAGRRFHIYEALSCATRALVVTWSGGTNWQYTAETLVAVAYERLKQRWGEW